MDVIVLAVASDKFCLDVLADLGDDRLQVADRETGPRVASMLSPPRRPSSTICAAPITRYLCNANAEL
jgi:hypothetical protein